MASHREVARFVEAHTLYGQGLGLVDAHLLASATLAPGTTLWMRNKRLRRVAEGMGRAHSD